MKSIIIALLIIFLANLTAADVLAQYPDWLVLDTVRVTFYGPDYVAGDVTASGIRYTPDNDTVALGPYHLAMVRDYYSPLRWWRNRDGELRYRAPAGCYPVLVTWNEARWWGCLVRMCAQGADGERLCRWLRMADTGTVALVGVDLPDRTWERWGWPAERGVFTGTLEVVRW